MDSGQTSAGSLYEKLNSAVVKRISKTWDRAEGGEKKNDVEVFIFFRVEEN